MNTEKYNALETLTKGQQVLKRAMGLAVVPPPKQSELLDWPRLREPCYANIPPDTLNELNKRRKAAIRNLGTAIKLLENPESTSGDFLKAAIRIVHAEYAVKDLLKPSRATTRIPAPGFHYRT